MLTPVLLSAAQRQRAHEHNSLLYSTSDSDDNTGNPPAEHSSGIKI